MTQDTFQRIYRVVQAIPEGKVSTYGDIAKVMSKADGHLMTSRTVGWALHANPDGGKTPCHRVVFSDGSLAPGYAFGGAGIQEEKLASEGVAFIVTGRTKKVDLLKHRITL